MAVWLCWPLSSFFLEVLPCGAMHCFRVFSLCLGWCCPGRVRPMLTTETGCRGQWVSRCRGWWYQRASRATTHHRPHRRWFIPRIHRRAITPRPHRCITPRLATTLAHPIRITARPIVRINMGTDMGTTATTMSVAMVGIVVAITAVVEGAHNHALVLVARSASA